jgi:hypothetical protein
MKWPRQKNRRKQRPRFRSPDHTVKAEPKTPVSEGQLDESLEETFPASDPPSFTVTVRVGAPSH